MTETSNAEIRRPWWATPSEPSKTDVKAEYRKPSWAKRSDDDNDIPTPGVIRRVVVGSLEDIAAAKAAGLKFEPYRPTLDDHAESLIFNGGDINLECGFRVLMAMAATYPCYEATAAAGADGRYEGCDDPRIIIRVLVERYGAEAVRKLAEQIKP